MERLQAGWNLARSQNNKDWQYISYNWVGWNWSWKQQWNLKSMKRNDKPRNVHSFRNLGKPRRNGCMNWKWQSSKRWLLILHQQPVTLDRHTFPWYHPGECVLSYLDSFLKASKTVKFQRQKSQKLWGRMCGKAVLQVACPKLFTVL